MNNTTDLALNAVSFLSDAQLLSLLEEFERKGSLSPALRFSSASGMVTDITAHVIVAMQRSIDGWEGPVVAKRYAEDLTDCRCALLKSSLISHSEHKKSCARTWPCCYPAFPSLMPLWRARVAWAIGLMSMHTP